MDALLPRPLVGGFVVGGLSGDGPDIDVGVGCDEDEAEVVVAWFDVRLDRKMPPKPLSRVPGDAEVERERFLVCVDGMEWSIKVGCC